MYPPPARSKAKLGKTWVIVRPSPERPTVYPVGILDWQIVDRGKPPLHHAVCIEFPVLIAVRAEPVSAVIMPFISKANGDAVVTKRPHLFD